MRFGAILLAGGRARRVDGAAKPLFDVGGRTLLQRAIDAVADCAPVTVVADPVPGVSGGAGVTWVREDPPFSGPAAAVVAALAAWQRAATLVAAAPSGGDLHTGGPIPEDRSSRTHISSRSEGTTRVDEVGEGATAKDAGAVGLPEWTFLLACDLPGVEAAVARLRRDLPLLPAETEGLCLADAGSRPQWLTGVYRTAALTRGAAALPDAGRDASLRALLDDLAVAVVAAPEAETDDVDTWDDLERARARFGDASRAPEADAPTADAPNTAAPKADALSEEHR